MEKYIHYNIALLFVAAIVLMGCKINKPSVTIHKDQYFTISIYSIGTGIDATAKNVVVNTIRSYEKKGNEIVYSVVPWGREGEIDYCFELQYLEPTLYDGFFKELSDLLKGKQVHINEKVVCRNKE